MDDIVILMHNIYIDLLGFNETQFVIFDHNEQQQLLEIWVNIANKNINTFISHLSPEQKKQLTIWLCSRTSYSTDELINALTKFTKFMKTVNYKTYPDVKKKSKKFRLFK